MANKPGRSSFGTVKLLPSGRYRVQYNGLDKTRHTAPTTFRTKRDANAWLSAEYRLLETGEWTPPANRLAAKAAQWAQEEVKSETFAAYVENTWWPRKEAAGKLSPRSQADYRKYLEKFILPTFGGTPHREITEADVLDWLNTAFSSKTPTQKFNVYSLLKQILTQASLDTGVPNPCARLSMTKPSPEKEARPATAEEIELAAAHMPPHLSLMVYLLAYCALRFGEAAALRREDVDTQRGTITVRRAVQWIDGKKTLGPPKAGSRREVYYPPHLASMVEEHMSTHARAGRGGLLFPNAEGGEYSPPKFYHYWYPAREAAGREDLRVHDLRHTGATMAAESGATIKEQQRRLGHKTASAALIYQHAAVDSDREIAARISARVTGRNEWKKE